VDEHHGLAYALFEPQGPRRGGIVILHGADSNKERHFEFARAARAWGFAAIAFDQRGHGATGGELDGRAIDDVVAIAALLRPGPLALRGSSMGAFMALAAASPAHAECVVAICPAGVELLLRGLRARRFGFRSASTLEPLLEAHDLVRTVTELAAPLLLMHADGDEQVPIAESEALAAVAPTGQFVRVAGGDHSAVQHDPELHGVSLRFIERAFAGTART
jgi:pimeloyl-ACP methyl ester carboxylesterase